MRQETREQLISLAEKEYKEFSAALVPGEERMLGVRLPKLRVLAKELAKGNWEEELVCEDIYFEEIMLRGMTISYVTLKMDPENALPYIRGFIPLVRNWSLCDSVFMKMDVLQKDPDLTWEFILPYMESGEEFQVRVALIIMMSQLLRIDCSGKKMSRLRKITPEHLEKVEEEKLRSGKYLPLILEKINREYAEGYYAHMAAAWLVAESFCAFPALTDKFLKTCSLDRATYNKALQKITESKIPDEEVKAYIRSRKK